MLIDSKDALTAVDDCNYKIMSGYEWIRKQEIKKRLKELPSAERIGHWVCTSSDHYKCSNCGTRASYWYNEENSCEWDKDMSEWLSDYCPNCGSRNEVNE